MAGRYRFYAGVCLFMVVRKAFLPNGNGKDMGRGI